MFFISAVVILAFLIGGVAFTDAFNSAMTALNTAITSYFGWFYILAASFFVIFVLWLMFSRYGNVRLGPDSSRPEFGTMAWFAMLFTAGMGIGLVFYGVSEPLSNATDPGFLKFMGIENADSGEVSTKSLSTTLFHWGFHPWSIYIVLGLALGYFCFRKGLPMRPAAALYPLIGNRIYGVIGYIVDILAVFGTLFGLATSLGIGTQQIGSGLESLFGIPNTPPVQILIISLMTAIAVASVMLGIDAGIRRLSVINLWLAAALMIFVFLVGPKLFIMTNMADVTGDYLSSVVGDSFRLFDPSLDEPVQEAGSSWQSLWTLYYWGWWLSWSPFVGMFLARISYGRTIRQFVVGTLFAPVAVSAVWFTVFGGAAMFYDVAKGNGELGKIVGQWEGADGAPEQGMFLLLDKMNVHGIVGTLAAVLTLLVVILFFATSSDSGSLVVDMLTNGGDPHPIKLQRFFWAVSEGVVTIVLLVIGGEQAVLALQTAALTTGLPFALILLVIAFALIKALRDEPPASLYPWLSQIRGAGGSGDSQARVAPGDTTRTTASGERAGATSTDGNQ